MKTSISLFLSLVFLFSTSWADSAHEEFLECLSLHNENSNSLSNIIYTSENTSYSSILLSTIRNLRFTSAAISESPIIITPLHESQIQAAIYCARNHGLHIRIRSGGHDYEGISHLSKIPYVIIDMSNFRSISIDTQNETAWVQVGATLGELYYNIAQQSRTLSFSAGVCPTVGVGGHFSGGGYGMISRKYGIAADNIIDAQIIDVNGRILDRKSMGEDLFWAIRGGGGASFGVIVSWKIKLLVVPEIVTVFDVSRTLEQNATKIVHRWQYVADKIDENLLLRLFIRSINSTSYGNRTIEASFTTLFLGGVNELLPLMQERFPELGLVREDCIEMSWIESILYFARFPNGSSTDVLLNRTAAYQISFFKGKSDYVQKPISENGLQRIWEWLLQEDAEGTSLQFSPYGGRLNSISQSEIPFPHRFGNIFMIHYGKSWREEGKRVAERNLSWLRSFYSFMASYVSRSPRGAYINYRDLDLGTNNEGNTSYRQASIWGLKYFKSNFGRLIQVKTMVDPSNFFRNEQSIPAISSWRRKRGD